MSDEFLKDEKKQKEIVSIAGSSRKVSREAHEIPLIFMDEAEEIGITQWYDSTGTIEEAQTKALKSGTFDGVIVVCITSKNTLAFMPAR